MTPGEEIRAMTEGIRQLLDELSGRVPHATRLQQELDAALEVAKDYKTLQGQFNQAVGELRQSLATVTKERDDWQHSYENLATVNLQRHVDLAAARVEIARLQRELQDPMGHGEETIARGREQRTWQPAMDMPVGGERLWIAFDFTTPLAGEALLSVLDRLPLPVAMIERLLSPAPARETPRS